MPTKSLISAVEDVYIETRKAKSGNEYQMLIVKFTSGYCVESFLNNDQKFILSTFDID